VEPIVGADRPALPQPATRPATRPILPAEVRLTIRWDDPGRPAVDQVLVLR
jgi:hypothetical protein